jgi:SAM-dependent methyltransferase
MDTPSISLVLEVIMDSWYEFYKDRVCDSYFDYVNIKYKRFIDEVYNTVMVENITTKSDISTIVEVGCGIGSITKAVSKLSLTSFLVSISLLDNSEEMLSLTRLNLKDEHLDAIYINRNVLDYKPYKVDVAYSHGLLEHFLNNDIKTIINNLKGAKQVHYVPSYKYVTPSRGDERLLTPLQWKEICNPDEIIEFNGGLDLILKWE